MFTIINIGAYRNRTENAGSCFSMYVCTVIMPQPERTVHLLRAHTSPPFLLSLSGLPDFSW
jgi:hypothetical protein